MNDKVQVFENKLGETGKVAILVGGLNSEKPFEFMNEAVYKYCDGTPVVQFVNIELNNPWTRLIIKGLNDLPFENYGAFLKKRERREKLKRINEIQP